MNTEMVINELKQRYPEENFIALTDKITNVQKSAEDILVVISEVGRVSSDLISNAIKSYENEIDLQTADFLSIRSAISLLNDDISTVMTFLPQIKCNIYSH